MPLPGLEVFSERLLLLGTVNKGLSMEKFWDAGIPCLHPLGVRRGGGADPPPFFRPDVIVACVFYE